MGSSCTAEPNGGSCSIFKGKMVVLFPDCCEFIHVEGSRMRRERTKNYGGSDAKYFPAGQ